MFKMILLHTSTEVLTSNSQCIGSNKNCHFESTTSIPELFLMFPKLFPEESDINKFQT